MRIGIGLSMSDRQSKGPFGNHPTLASGLISVWPLINGVDTYGVNDLSIATDGVTFVPKGTPSPENMPGTVVNIAGNTKVFGVTTTAFNGAGDLTYSYWIRIPTGATWGTDQFLNQVSMFDNYLSAARVLTVRAFDSISGTVSVSPVTLSLDVWYNIVTWYDSATKTVNGTANAGSTATSGALTNSLAASSTGFQIQTGATATDLLNMSGMYRWNRVLTAAERTALYNSGNGLFY